MAAISGVIEVTTKEGRTFDLQTDAAATVEMKAQKPALHSRWEQIRENAIERAAQRKTEVEGDGEGEGEGDSSGEESRSCLHIIHVSGDGPRSR